MLALALMLFVTAACAADHLVPGKAVSQVEADVLLSDVDVLAVVYPPFAPEYAVGIRVHNGDYRVFALHAKEEGWPRVLKGQPADASQYCETPITPALGARVAGVWEAMLRAVAPDSDAASGLDLAQYKFAKVVDGKVALGDAWDRDGDSKVGMLQAIAAAMDQLCHSPGDFERERFVSSVDALAAQLQLPPTANEP
jgi:hypothetical protein